MNNQNYFNQDVVVVLHLKRNTIEQQQKETSFAIVSIVLLLVKSRDIATLSQHTISRDIIFSIYK